MSNRMKSGLCVAIAFSLFLLPFNPALAASPQLVGWIEARTRWMAPVVVYPGGDEMNALAAGALRVLRGEEEALTYA